MMAKVGEPAPKFTMDAVTDGKFQTVSLESLKGKWVVLFFYPLDFTFVCPTEITDFSKHGPQFAKHNAVVIGCSTDSVYSHQAWLKDLGKLNYPLAADKNMEVARDYGVLVEDKGIALRGAFIIDAEGILRYAVIHDLNVGRNVEEIIRVLAAFQTGELCQAGWKPGEKTLGKA
jgi:peroxiredoxin 2/4